MLLLKTGRGAGGGATFFSAAFGASVFLGASAGFASFLGASDYFEAGDSAGGLAVGAGPSAFFPSVSISKNGEPTSMVSPILANS